MGWLHFYSGRLGVIVVDLCYFALFWRLFTIKMIKSVEVFPFSFWKMITFFYFIKINPPALTCKMAAKWFNSLIVERIFSTKDFVKVLIVLWKIVCTWFPFYCVSFQFTSQQASKWFLRISKDQIICTLCCISLGSFTFLALFWAHIGQPDNHIGWATLMPFASIYSSNLLNAPYFWSSKKR